MTHSARAACGIALGAAALAACLEERPRPAPPVLSISFARDTVRSPDTLTGTVSARDGDGVDSIWLSVDSTRVGADALLQAFFSTPFAMPIRSGHAPGDTVAVVLQARDLPGFANTLDTFVTVVK